GVAIRLVVEFALLTTRLTGLDETPARFAVRTWVPTASEDVWMLAVPLARLAVPFGIGMPPSRKVTVPVVLDGLAVAVMVTFCPKVAGLGFAERLRAVFWLTV